MKLPATIPCQANSARTPFRHRKKRREQKRNIDNANVTARKAKPAGARHYRGMTKPQQERALTVDDFDYALPPDLIAQHPAPERAASRLLRLGAGGALSDHLFADLPRLLATGDLLVLNDTRVVKARLTGIRDTGGRVEVLIERVSGPREALAQIRASHAPRP